MVKLLLLLVLTANIFVLASSIDAPIRCRRRNEVYDPCPSPCPLRTCGINDAAVKCAQALPNGHSDCPPPTCRCRDGFYRNHLSNCVRWKNCPTCKRPKEIYDPCLAPCPERACGVDKALILCQVSPQLGDPECKPGCRCMDGFVKNKTGICIPEDECPPQCPSNEVYSNCIQGNCSPQNCSQVGFPVPSPRIDPTFCKKGCLCIAGYVRNNKGYCIPSSECPSCGGDRNKVAGCGVYCNQRCINIGKEPDACIEVCYDNACGCRKGYYLDDNTGFCVLPKQCTPTCPSNEIYSNCINSGCQARNCSQYGKPVPCIKIDPKYCKEGCICKDTYLRASNGQCISEENCPGRCLGPNEYYSCGGACDNVCETLDKQSQDNCPIVNIKCNEMCYCEPGYARAKNNTCIPISSCDSDTPPCPENEWYSECTQSNCSPENCKQVGFPLACPAIDPKYCKKGCLCNQGYARNYKGFCIPLNKCRSCGGDPNAQPGCGGNCNRHCSDIGKEPGACALICELNGCDCKQGFYYDDRTNKCVKPEQCSPTCPSNEIYSNCINSGCQARNCSQYGKPVPCIKIDPKYCKEGCICKDTYLRASNGQCIPEENCPGRCLGPNEYYSCGGACDNVCETLDEQSQDNCPIVNIKCNEMCYCEPGYARAKNNTCIPISSCDSDTPPCPENEWYSECTQSNCSPENCKQVGFPLACPAIDPKYCKKGCLCNQGYARNYKGFCIPLNKCRLCGGDPNAQPGCGGNCNRHCSDIGKEPGACALICELNGCDCKQGFYYDDRTNKCVKPEQCPPTCPSNEIYSNCINSGCQARNCSQYGKPVPCIKIDPKYCKEGCICKDTYLRASNGQCIPEENCPGRCLGPNEYYSCGGACDNVCETLDEQSQDNCPIVNIKCNEMCYCEPGYARAKNNTCIPISSCDSDNTVCGQNEMYEDCSNPVCEAEYCTDLGLLLDCSLGCRKGCICKDGYVRDDNGRCIPIEKCPSCGGDPNAVRGCGVNCGRRCSNIDNNEAVACPDICRLNGCDCKEGFYYDDITEKCVRPEDCAPKCPLNERYEECPGSSCEPQYCDELGYSSYCSPQPADGSCSTKPGCVCVDGYVRDENGKCIPKNQCPSCGGDNNAQSGCGVNCGKRCRDLVKAGGSCIRICYVNSCDCKDGFYFDSNQNKCVLANQCTDICGKNEVFEDCSDPICRAKNCTQVGFPLDCNETCIKGCVCRNGYVRNNNGICICIKNCHLHHLHQIDQS